MNNFIVLSALFLPMISLAQDEETDTRGALSSDQLKEEHGLFYEKELDSKTPYTGLRRDFYPNGQMQRQGKYVDGKTEGLWTNWYENGPKRVEATYRNGKMKRGSQWWDENGNTKKPEKRP